MTKITQNGKILLAINVGYGAVWSVINLLIRLDVSMPFGEEKSRCARRQFGVQSMGRMTEKSLFMFQTWD